MKRVGIVLHGARREAATTAAELSDMLAARRIETVAIDADFARVQSGSLRAVASLPADLDMVFVLGGDGTLLRAAEMVGSSGTPLLGINFGGLGFLSALERTELTRGLARVLDDGYEVEERMVLRGEIATDGAVRPVWAMNDIVIEKRTIGRAIKIAVAIGGEPFLTMAADGIILATPTGSTAYSFSAGGPVVSPRIDCVIVTPVSSHGLFRAPVIVPPDEPIVIRVLPALDMGGLSADGQAGIPLEANTEVRLRAEPRGVRLVKIDPAPFWRLVHKKFRLTGGRR